MTPRHVAEVAGLHQRLLPGLLTDLGPHAISYFYETALEIPGTHAWVVAEGEQKIIGFALGSELGADLFGRILRRRPFRGMRSVALAVFSRPASFMTVGGWLLKGGPADPAFEGAELIYLAVDPEGRGGGSAHFLFKQAYDLFRDKGFAQFQLSVADDNGPAQRFFESMGGKRVGTYEEGEIRRLRYAFRYGN
jgi:ribosomal protein S18 acetylase RimI-like enzyme